MVKKTTVQQMKRTVDNLSPKDRAALARWYDSDSYKALAKLLELERLEIAKGLLIEKETNTIVFHQGQADGLKRLHQTIRELHKTEKS